MSEGDFGPEGVKIAMLGSRHGEISANYNDLDNTPLID
jgi:hypothetical protein